MINKHCCILVFVTLLRFPISERIEGQEVKFQLGIIASSRKIIVNETDRNLKENIKVHAVMVTITAIKTD